MIPSALFVLIGCCFLQTRREGAPKLTSPQGELLNEKCRSIVVASETVLSGNGIFQRMEDDFAGKTARRHPTAELGNWNLLY